MKRSIWVRLMAVILVISMVAAPVSAVPNSGKDSAETVGLIGQLIEHIKDVLEDIFDGSGDETPTEPNKAEKPGKPEKPAKPEKPEKPTEPAKPEKPGKPEKPTEPVVTEPVVTEPVETEPEVTEPETPVLEQTLVEGHANTVNGNLLRGVTYSLSQMVAQEPQTAPYALRSSNVSTYALTAAAEETTSISDTALVITYDENGNAIIPDGDYVLYSSVNQKYMTNSLGWSNWSSTTLMGSADSAGATIWTFTTQANGSYTVQDPDGKYLNIERENAANLSADPVYLKITQHSGNNVIVMKLNAENVYCYLNALGASAEYNYFGGWSDGSPITLYAVTTTEPEQPEQSEGDLIYYPVTMFNYDEDVIRRWTNQAEVEAGLKETWQGLYFSGGKPAATSYTYSTSAAAHSNLTWQQVMDGTYYADEACAQSVTVTPVTGSGAGQNYVETTVTAQSGSSSGTQYFVQYQNSGYYYKVNNNYYEITSLQFGNRNRQWRIGCNGTTYNVNGVYTLTIYELEATTTITGYTLTAGGNTLATLDGTDLSAEVAMPLYTPAGETTVNKEYAEWNWWAYKTNGDDARNKFYAGLAKDELVDGQIQFTHPDPGLFTYDATKPEVTNDGIKDIYQNVGLPFVIDKDGFYTFDSDAHGTYFADTNGDGHSDPKSGASNDYSNLFFDRGNTQGWEGMYYGDGSTNLWAPFNTNANDTGEGAIDYHFGMRADLPFSMTPNGCINSTNDNSPPITFEFQGDDDVWIFIDGHLVIDLGGIHNRLGARINFADNTITYYLPESNHNTNPFGAFNLEGFELVQKLYDDASSEGALGQTRTAFASQEEHHMTIFYLERGKGTSNCKIQFNLPMRDTLMVTKDASMSWSAKQDEADKENGDGTAPLTSSEQAAVNNIPFGFTLYKKEANATVFTPVANTNYFLQDQNGVVQYTDHTDANGHFYLKNGETAKFMTTFPKEGVTYYVVEDKTPEGFLTPDYKYDGETTRGAEYYDSTDENDLGTKVDKCYQIPEQELPTDATENKSYVVTVKGSMESIDSLEFICVNYMNAELPSPTALAYEDMIVIDYGLPVHIDPLANDLYRGETIDIVAWGDESLTLNEVLDQYGNAVSHDDANAEKKTTWSGGKEFHSGTVTFLDKPEDIAQYGRKTFKYELNKQLTEVEVISYIIKVTANLDEYINDEYIGTKTACRYALAKVYIAPATIMYYEENFSDMVTFAGSGWKTESTVFDATKVSPYQEDGVVGDSRNHTYGTDSAYLEDNSDSNGTHRFGDTTNGAIRFTYTFTGTGTSIFARTSANTGYMQVKIYEGETASGAYMDVWYRDTYWKDENLTQLDASGVLYNVPVYTNEDLDYGTYTVVCTIAKKGSPTDGNVAGAGNEFYLDGIRVMQPLNIVVEEEAVYDNETGELISPTVYDAMTTKALNAYTIDGESNLDVVTLRQKLITDAENGEAIWDGENFVVLTDINGEITTAEDYTSIGPKEEVYLKPGQKVTFSLKYWEPEGLKLYVGMKAPFGSALVNVGHDVYKLKNAADSYYDVTDNSASLVEKYEQLYNSKNQPLFNDPNDNEVYMTEDGGFYYSENNNPVPEDTELTPKDDLNQPYFVVTYTFEATENDTTAGIVSLTNIKVVGSHEFTIVENTDINQ